MNDAYMPAPSRKAARLVVQTPRMRIIVMSTSGFLLRVSTKIQPRVFDEPQPHVVVSETASSTTEMPIVISAAATQLTLPGTRTGDSGIKRQVATAASTVATSGSQNSQW